MNRIFMSLVFAAIISMTTMSVNAAELDSVKEVLIEKRADGGEVYALLPTSEIPVNVYLTDAAGNMMTYCQSLHRPKDSDDYKYKRFSTAYRNMKIKVSNTYKKK